MLGLNPNISVTTLNGNKFSKLKLIEMYTCLQEEHLK